MKTALVIIGLLMLLGIMVGWAIWAWQQTAGVEMSGHGYAAMLLGIFFTLLVGCGLMAHMFYSSRHGYDEGATDLSDKDKH
jgi:predicted Na+-dependent transporter